MLRIYIDFDGTLVDSPEAMAQWYNYRYNTSVKGKDIYKWDASDQCPKLTAEEIVGMFESQSFFSFLEPEPNAVEITKRINHFPDYHLICCSIGTPENLRLKREYLDKYFPWIKEKILIERQDVFMGKNGYVNDGILIDDNQENLDGSSLCDILYKPHGEKEYNVDFKGITVESWSEVPDLLYQIYNIYTKYTLGKEMFNVIRDCEDRRQSRT